MLRGSNGAGVAVIKRAMHTPVSTSPAGTVIGVSKSTTEIVYEQAVRAVDQQVRQLDELRTRAAVVFAASGVVTGFLGRTAVSRGLGGFGFCALVAFVASALACIWVLLPRWESWEFSINAKALGPFFLDEADPEPPEALFKYLGVKIQDDFEENATELERLYGGFSIACVSLALEVILWLLALGLD
jgi:hypothetical protein